MIRARVRNGVDRVFEWFFAPTSSDNQDPAPHHHAPLSISRPKALAVAAVMGIGASIAGGVAAPAAHADASAYWNANCNAYVPGNSSSWGRIIVKGTGCPGNGHWRVFIATGGPSWRFDSGWWGPANVSWGGGSGGVAVCMAIGTGESRCGYF
jgi:hypothetical protein